jgi:hypothetical protein
MVDNLMLLRSFKLEAMKKKYKQHIRFNFKLWLWDIKQPPPYQSNMVRFSAQEKCGSSAAVQESHWENISLCCGLPLDVTVCMAVVLVWLMPPQIRVAWLWPMALQSAVLFPIQWWSFDGHNQMSFGFVIMNWSFWWACDLVILPFCLLHYVSCNLVLVLFT